MFTQEVHGGRRSTTTALAGAVMEAHSQFPDRYYHSEEIRRHVPVDKAPWGVPYPEYTPHYYDSPKTLQVSEGALNMQRPATLPKVRKRIQSVASMTHWVCTEPHRAHRHGGSRSAVAVGVRYSLFCSLTLSRFSCPYC